MDVDGLLMTCGEIESRVQRRDGVAVDQGRVQRAEHVGAAAQRLVEQCDGALTFEHARLRKCNRLHVEHVAQCVARLQHAFEVLQAGVGIDIDVGAQAGRARLQEGTGQCERCSGRVVSALRAKAALVFDAIGELRTHFVAIPAHAPHRLVEMRVAFDEAGQQQRAMAMFARDIVFDL